ncbi:SAM-dependent methyltransferase [Mangrovimicrobium sediminis]|uniref:tRNA (guanine(46)-N(7))-methyltransferase n=1 Tax=Mangrovimicrobium sediminis TaxID=2562682 RepID=A0A4Z0M0M3_9GAMM|nr:methyltransferase domain-containing protein [Haliea sp. SAOS-164]TGD73069.1 SAM-dependent methyltransferase [Haliea sp. SAOS-164]
MSEPGNSRPVHSNQPGIHAQLPAVLRRHLDNPYRRPPAAHSRRAYAQLTESLAGQARPLVLDAFCGTGQSTALLARDHPQHLVVGIDRSAHRLARHASELAGDYLLLQAEVEDIWALLLADGLHVEHHYLLYPNPWPKSKHLMRRVHGHPAFGRLLDLGGTIELRSNWQLYVEEFGLAMHLAGRRGAVSQVAHTPPLTLFESKYRDSGHSLWCYRAGAVTNANE